MICPFCAEEIKDQAKLCRFCGKDIPEVPAATVQAQASTVKMNETVNQLINLTKGLLQHRKVVAIALAVVLLIAGGALGCNKYSDIKENNRLAALAEARAAAQQAEREAYQAAVDDMSWVPSGFRKFSENPFVAYKKDNSQSCSTYGACFPFIAITNKYCSSLYIRANSINDYGVVDDNSSDSATGITAGQRVKMKIQFSTDDAGTVEFTDVDCD